ncbi:MAG: hypothetical protein WBS54_02520 [Acidobacteriota bacterium]
MVNSNDGQIADTSQNQINAEGSAFYDADTREIQQPYDDTFIQFIVQSSGSGAVPYLPPDMLSLFDYNGDCNNLTQDQARALELGQYALAWFANSGARDNYFQLLGVACSPVISACSSYEYSGNTLAAGHFSIVSRCVFEANDLTHATPLTQDATDHELGHQFKVNQCTDSDSGHDADNAWCGTCGGTATEKCLMNESRDGTNGIIRFGTVDMVGPRAACPSNTDAAIRTHTDPIP